MPLTTSTKNTILRALTAKSGAVASSIYIGLSSTAPTEAGANVTEPVGNGYARVLIGNYNQSATQLFGEPVDGVSTNNAIVYFPESTGSWGEPLTHFVLFSSQTGAGSNYVLGYGELKEDGTPSPVTVSAEKTVVMFRKGALTISYADV